MNKAYEINRNLDHMKSNKDYDTWQLFQDRKEKFVDLFWKLELIRELPSHQFEGKINRLSWLDYPRDMLLYPIISEKLLQVLLSVSQFQHELFPLKIIDWKSEETTDNFIFLHLLECIEAIDYEKSIYYEDLIPKEIQQYALKEPSGGYPPLFRVKNASLTWFVSAEAKEALEAADIKGVRFIPLIAS